MKKYFRDPYGCTASITTVSPGIIKLRIADAYGKRIVRKTFQTERGARIAMGKYSDGWTPVWKANRANTSAPCEN